eukprot:scaffold569132_cov17-Prasinocladus_malaysianus.AAC.1
MRPLPCDPIDSQQYSIEIIFVALLWWIIMASGITVACVYMPTWSHSNESKYAMCCRLQLAPLAIMTWCQ